jgi:hypothetical protein
MTTDYTNLTQITCLQCKGSRAQAEPCGSHWRVCDGCYGRGLTYNNGQSIRPQPLPGLFSLRAAAVGWAVESNSPGARRDDLRIEANA